MEIKGQWIPAAITEEVPSDRTFRVILKIIKEIGPIAKPDKIQVVPGYQKHVLANYAKFFKKSSEMFLI